MKKVKTVTPIRAYHFMDSLWNYTSKQYKHTHKAINQPFSISLEMSSICNLKCAECPSGQGKVKRTNAVMNIETAKKIIDRHAKSAMITQLFFQGEPFFNKHWDQILAYASSKNLYTIINTNGHFLHTENCQKLIDNKLDRIVVSLDGATAETYNRYRKNGQFELVTDGIKQLVKARNMRKVKYPKITMQTLLTRETENQMDEFKKLQKTLGADSVKFKTMQLYDLSNENMEYWLPQNNRHRRYQTQEKKSKKINCWRALTTAVYTSDGDLVSCCFDKTAQHNFGHIDHNPWESEKHRTFLQHMVTGKTIPDICHNCIRK